MANEQVWGRKDSGNSFIHFVICILNEYQRTSNMHCMGNQLFQLYKIEECG